MNLSLASMNSMNLSARAPASVIELTTGYDAAPKAASFSSRGVPRTSESAARAGATGSAAAAARTPAATCLVTALAVALASGLNAAAEPRQSATRAFLSAILVMLCLLLDRIHGG